LDLRKHNSKTPLPDDVPTIESSAVDSILPTDRGNMMRNCCEFISNPPIIFLDSEYVHGVREGNGEMKSTEPELIDVSTEKAFGRKLYYDNY